MRPKMGSLPPVVGHCSVDSQLLKYSRIYRVKPTLELFQSTQQAMRATNDKNNLSGGFDVIDPGIV